MTVEELIRFTDGVKPNAYTLGQKAAWLGDLEAALWTEQLLQSAGDWDGQMFARRRLLLPEAWRRLYGAWLAAMIDLANGETGKYAASMALYNRAAQDFGAWYAERFDPAGRASFWASLGRAAYTASDGSAVRLGALPRGSAVLAAVCRVETAFDGDANALSLGTAARSEALLGEAEVQPSSVGEYRRLGLFLPAAGDGELCSYCTCTGSPTAGSAELLILIQPGKEC